MSAPRLACAARAGLPLCAWGQEAVASGTIDIGHPRTAAAVATTPASVRAAARRAQVHKFSKFIHGSATLLPDLVQAVPYWVDDESVRPSMLQSAPAAPPACAPPPLHPCPALTLHPCRTRRAQAARACPREAGRRRPPGGVACARAPGAARGPLRGCAPAPGRLREPPQSSMWCRDCAARGVRARGC